MHISDKPTSPAAIDENSLTNLFQPFFIFSELSSGRVESKDHGAGKRVARGQLPSESEQIRAHLQREDSSVRTHDERMAALQADGLGVSSSCNRNQKRAACGAIKANGQATHD